MHECWMNIGFGGIKPGHNKQELTLPFTPESTSSVSVFASLTAQDAGTEVSQFTKVSVIAIANSPNKINVDAYNDGTTTVDARVSIHVMERVIY